MAINPATADVAITNWPSVQAVSGTVASAEVESAPSSEDILFGSRTTTGTLFTVPAGRVWRGSISLAGAISVAGNATCSVSIPAGTLHSLPVTGLALTALASANTLDNVYIHGGVGGVAVTFNAGATGSTAGSATGRLL